MSKRSEIVDKHCKDLNKISKQWEDSFPKAKKGLIDEKGFAKKRKELTEKLNKFRKEEEEAINEFKKVDNLYNEEFIRNERQLAELDGQQNTLSFQAQASNSLQFERRSQQMNQIFHDFQNEIRQVVDKHKSQVNRLDQTQATRLLADRQSNQSSQAVGVPLSAQIQQLIQQSNLSRNEIIHKLGNTQQKIDQQMNQLKELEKALNEKILKINLNSQKSEREDRSNEMNNYFKKVNDVYRKK